MRKGSYRGRRPSTPPRRTQRKQSSSSSSTCASSAASGHGIGVADDPHGRRAASRGEPRSGNGRNANRHAAQGHDFSYGKKSPPVTQTSSLSDKSNSHNAHVALGHKDCASAEAVQLADDTEGKDGMRGPPSWRPLTTSSVNGSEPHAGQSRPHGTSAAATRLPHTLVPPPRRKFHAAAQVASSTTSSSSRGRSSGSDMTDRTSSAADDDDADSRDLCERCLYNRRRKRKKSYRSRSTADSREGKGGKHSGILEGDASWSAAAAAVSSRRSRTSRSSYSSKPQQRGKARQQQQQRRRPSSKKVSFTGRDRRSDSTGTSLSHSESFSSGDRGSESSEEDSRADGEELGSDDEHSSDKDESGGSSSSDSVLSSSSSAASPCALTDILPRDIYLHICSFLNEVDCCTLLEVSLRMHAAITTADSYVWRRLCMDTWRYKQGFQTFIQRIRALEGLACREEREVQALQQHMLLLREQGTFFGASDVSATCDDATVLIRRRQHERAQWMAAAASAPSSRGGSRGLHRTRRSTTVGSSTTSASSETRTTSDDSSEGRDGDERLPHRRRGREGNRRRRRSLKSATHRSSGAGATASTSLRSGRQPSTHSNATKARRRSDGAASRSTSRAPSSSSGGTLSPTSRRAGQTAFQPPSAQSKQRHPAASEPSERTKAALQTCKDASSNKTSSEQVNGKASPQQYSDDTAAPVTGGKSGKHTHHLSTLDRPPSGAGEHLDTPHEDKDAIRNTNAIQDTAEAEGRRKDRRVRIRLPEGAEGDDQTRFCHSHADPQPSNKPRSPGSAPPSHANSQQHRRQRQPPHPNSPNLGKHDHHESDTPKQQRQQRQSTQQPPISKHRRSHSVKKRKPAKQRRRKRGRSRRPRTTGGGGGRHRSQHHRSQSRHHRSSHAQHSHHHHHHHHPKATKSTRRRRRRQRNAAAAASAAADDSRSEQGRSGTSMFSGPHSGNTHSSTGGGAGASHGSTFFYQTPTYEAIKSTTPVLGAQHVAPAMVPFQLGGRPAAPLQLSATTPLAVSGMSRYPSRDSDDHQTPQPAAAFGEPTREPTSSAAEPATGALSAPNLHNGLENSGRVAPSTQAFVPSPTSSSRNGRERGDTVVSLSRHPPLQTFAPTATTGVAPHTGSSLAAATPAPSANSTEEDGLYWWQLTPEARHQQLLRMQQREQRQQQRSAAAAAAAAAAGPSSAAADGEEVADEATLREWDALEASFGSAAAIEHDDEDEEDDDDDDEGDLNSDVEGEEEEEEESHCSSSPVSTDASASTNSSDSSSYTGDSERRAKSSHLCSRHRRRSDAHSKSNKDSSTSSTITHTSPPSSRASQGSHPLSIDDTSEHNSDDTISDKHPTSSDAGEGGAAARDRESRTSGASHARHGLGKLTSLSSSRVSQQAERQLARQLARRYESVEEAMIVTRSKSVLIHTLERQTHAHLPRLLAAAAQRQRQIMLAARVASGAYTDSASALSPLPAGPANAASPNSAALNGSSCVSAVEGGTLMRPVLLIGSERSPASSPPTLSTAAPAASSASTLPSSLSNAFPTSPGVALTVPASPLHQLARISSSAALMDGALQTQSISYSSPIVQLGEERRFAHDIDVGISAHQRSLLQLEEKDPVSGSNAPEDDDDVEEDDEPLAPVSWKFAFFMSRREARRSAITLQDLLEGMWLVCFRTTGRTHPIRFTRQMQILVYPPLRTPEEEEEEEDDHDDEAEGGEGSAARSAAGLASVVRTGAAAAPMAAPSLRPSLAAPRAAAHTFTARGSAAPSATTAAPPLPFHILQSGAQLVVHQFPPMKVQRRSVLSVQRPSVSSSSSSSAASSVVRCHASAPTTTTTAGGATAQRTAASEGEQRFLAEPQATLRHLRLRMMTAMKDGLIGLEPALRAKEENSAVSFEENKGAGRVRCDAQNTAEVTQASVRHTIAHLLGLAATYVTDALGLPNASLTTAASNRNSNDIDDGRGPLSGDAVARPRPAATRRAASQKARERRQPKFFGPPTLKEFEAQQRLEACFAAGGTADVLNDWGWTITGHHVKIFSLDVTAPLYVERLQRFVDVEVMGRSHGEGRSATHV